MNKEEAAESLGKGLVAGVVTAIMSMGGPILVLLRSMFVAVILAPAIRTVADLFIIGEPFTKITWGYTTALLIFITYLGDTIQKITPRLFSKG